MILPIVHKTGLTVIRGNPAQGKSRCIALWRQLNPQIKTMDAVLLEQEESRIPFAARLEQVSPIERILIAADRAHAPVILLEASIDPTDPGLQGCLRGWARKAMLYRRQIIVTIMDGTLTRLHIDHYRPDLYCSWIGTYEEAAAAWKAATDAQ